MGGRGSSSGKINGAATSKGVTARSETKDSKASSSANYDYPYTTKQITRDRLFNAIEAIDPADFATYQQPDTIRVSGVEFNRLSSSESRNPSNGNKIFLSHYQATKAATDGTYPTFRIVVERNTRKTKGVIKATYKYDKSTAGTTVD